MNNINTRPGVGPFAVVRQQTEGQQEAFVLDSYLLHTHMSTCACGCTAQWSTVQEVWIHPRGTIRNLKPAKTVRPGVCITTTPVAHIQPICEACAPQVHENSARITSEAEWRATLARKYAPETRTARPASTPKPPPAIEDL